MGEQKAPLILIVERDRAIAWMIAQMLDLGGYRAESVRDLDAAQKLLARDRPQLIALDPGRPGGGSAAFLMQLRAKRCRRPAVVLLTTQQRIRPELRALADDLLDMPFNMQQLLHVIGAALARARPRRAASDSSAAMYLD